MHAIYELLARLPRAHAHRLLTTDCPSPPVSAVVARTNANTTAGRLPPALDTAPLLLGVPARASPRIRDRLRPRRASRSLRFARADCRRRVPPASYPFESVLAPYEIRASYSFGD